MKHSDKLKNIKSKIYKYCYVGNYGKKYLIISEAPSKDL